MKNYVITDIDKPDTPYPSTEGREFKSLYEYLELARKAIMYFAPKGYIKKQMMGSEDAISMIAYKIMLADWRYKQEKGCSEKTWRYKAAKYAVMDFLESQGKVKNKKLTGFRTNDMGKSYEVADLRQDSPVKQIKEEERLGRIRNRIEFGMKNAKLSEAQKKCLQLRYFESEPDGNLFSYEKIGKMMDPPVSRQAVEQNIKRALLQLKLVLKSENG